jgi:hypothetical protein
MNTVSEDLFEAFLTSNSLAFSRIEETQNQKGARRPDYRVILSSGQLIFELKQLSDDDVPPSLLDNTITIGEALRQRISSSKKQIQFGVAQGIPSILIVYNNLDPLQMRGTGFHDFHAAMYGELTMNIDKRTAQTSDLFNGQNSQLQESKNTSFSAVGHLCDRDGTTTVILWENVYAKLPLPFGQLPTCFAVQRVAIDNAQLSYS